MGIESMISLSGMVMTPVFAAGLPLAAINWHSVLFLLFASLASIFAVGVVLADNVVRMALYLVFSLAATAGLFFLAGAEFIGAMQLMIYVGGTLVLLVFGVMLRRRPSFRSSLRRPIGPWRGWPDRRFWLCCWRPRCLSTRGSGPG